MTFFIVLFLLLMQFLWRYIDELVGKGLEFKIIGELLIYASSSLVPLALPLAVLLSSLMAFGNMGEYYELTAIKSSGISLRRVMMPLIVLVMGVTAGAFFFANNILPVTNLKMKSLLYDVRQQRPEVQITEGVFYNGLENYSIRVERKDPNTNLLYSIKIYDHSAHKGNIKVTVADSGQMKMTADRRNMVITLWNGYSYSERDEGKRKKTKGYYPHQMDKFGEQRIIIEMTGFEFLRSDENIFRNSYQMLNVSQLKRASDSINRELNSKSIEFYQTLLRTNYFKLTPSSKTVAGAQNTWVVNNNPPVVNNTIRTAPAAGIRNFPVRSGRSPVTRPVIQKPDTAAREDSVQVTKTVIKVHDFDSLYNTFHLEKKEIILKTAINNVNMAHYMFNNTATNIEFETKYLRRHEIEWHRKFTLAFACMIFLFIGAPLGAIIRKGGLGLPTVISTLLFILYYIISMTGEKFVRESVLSSFQGMWLSSMVLVVAGVFLTYQATNDSAMLNLDTYINWIREKAGLKSGILLEKKSHYTGRFELNDIPKATLQLQFSEIIQLAEHCIESLRTDSRWTVLFKKALTNTGFFYLIEFGIHYNSFIDAVILSPWFRIPYFQKRLAEFPLINGRIAEPTLRNRFLLLTHWVVFPLGLMRLIHLRIKIMHIRRDLKKVMDLSSGMINLINSSVVRPDVYFA
jgi:lipopolysaccharide export system permease protein